MQIPDIRTDDDVIDAVVVDEEAVGGEGRGRGAKILYGKGALDQYLSEQKNDSEVCIICGIHEFSFCGYQIIPNHAHAFVCAHRPWRHQPQIMKQIRNFLPLLPACNLLQIIYYSCLCTYS